MKTSKEKVYKAIKLHLREFGHAPTIEELRTTVGVQSGRTVLRYLKILESEKKIERWKGARGIRLASTEPFGGMTCEWCGRYFAYCFWIEDKHWLKAVGQKEGHVCAHCLLHKLGGVRWRIIWTEPTNEERDERIIAMSESGMSYAEIGRVEQLSRERVRVLLNEIGVICKGEK